MSSENTQYKPNICFSCQDKDRERAELVEIEKKRFDFIRGQVSGIEHCESVSEQIGWMTAEIQGVRAERDALKAENERLKRDSNKFTLYFKDKSITLMTGMGAGCVWLELEDGEGGDFEMAQLYEIIRGFYDERF